MAGIELNQKAIAKTIGDVIAERDALLSENATLQAKYRRAMKAIAATIEVVESGAYDADIILNTIWPKEGA